MRRFLTGLADLIFPPRCIACSGLLDHSGESPFCGGCFSRFPFIKSPLCPRCGVPYPADEDQDHLCGECITAQRPFRLARAVGRYEGGLLEVIQRFKYQGKTTLGGILGRLMAGFDDEQLHIGECSLIIPVPLHARRLRDRGFNQSVILARQIAGRHSLPLDFSTLRRTLYTEPQVNLGKEERGPNVRGAFAVTGSGRIRGEKILLVDDVYTTGSTVAECAAVLRKNGAADVSVLTLARAV